MTASNRLLSLAFATAAIAAISIATTGQASAKGGHGGHGGGGFKVGFAGGGKFFHGGHRWHRWGHGYAYSTCWKWTPYGLIDVCGVPY